MNLNRVQNCVSRDDTFNILNERKMYGVNLQYKCDSNINFCFSNINERGIVDHKNRIRKAILMIGSCADAYYHFPVEYISHLYDLRNCNLVEYKIVLLKNKRNDWQRMWIEMFLPECTDNIVILNKEDLKNLVEKLKGLFDWSNVDYFTVESDPRRVDEDRLIYNHEICGTNRISFGMQDLDPEVQRRVKHPIYGKFVKKTSKLTAHDEQNQCDIGDLVRVMETRPISKNKRWRLTKIVEKVK